MADQKKEFFLSDFLSRMKSGIGYISFSGMWMSDATADCCPSISCHGFHFCWRSGLRLDVYPRFLGEFNQHAVYRMKK